MSVYQVNRLIYAMKMDASLAERFRNDRSALLREWELSDDERSALDELDFDRLRRSGVVPNLLLRLSSIAQVPLDRLTATAPTQSATNATQTE
jgi:hypothetical protein